MSSSTISYLRSLSSVRDRCSLLLNNPISLSHFDLNLDRLTDVVNLVLDLIQRDYPDGPHSIPPHSRWRHFEPMPMNWPPISTKKADRIAKLVAQWISDGFDTNEIVRKLLDLFVVSVLLDAGAGDRWSYTPVHPISIWAGDNIDSSRFDGPVYRRSEGLAIASLDWFLSGAFSSSPSDPHRVDAAKLQCITENDLLAAFQVDQHSNPLVGAAGRTQLLNRLGAACAENNAFFGNTSTSLKDLHRPGNMLDFLLAHPSTTDSKSHPIIPVSALWEVVMDGLSSVWPATRTSLNGIPMGDMWPSRALATIVGVDPSEASTDDTKLAQILVPFHKLSQWLTYSLMEPITHYLNAEFSGIEAMTGLAEYRNGGLFVDCGVLIMKPSHEVETAVVEGGAVSHELSARKRATVEDNPSSPVRTSAAKRRKDESASVDAELVVANVPRFHPHEDVVVEWRALTVALLDLTGKQVRDALGMTEHELPLVKVLEAGTWKAGREMAAKLRPQTKGPPIEIISDGTVF
ncbi:hypothetical protein BJ742DRAFT_56405 [Cladochytrium replicatum]|nr:hypothetical protein BJ742DRAFT_56405 [Cladochytrium replicatum]